VHTVRIVPPPPSCNPAGDGGAASPIPPPPMGVLTGSEDGAIFRTLYAEPKMSGDGGGDKGNGGGLSLDSGCQLSTSRPINGGGARGFARGAFFRPAEVGTHAGGTVGAWRNL
jgi:hypothetical protein